MAEWTTQGGSVTPFITGFIMAAVIFTYLAKRDAEHWRELLDRSIYLCERMHRDLTARCYGDPCEDDDDNRPIGEWDDDYEQNG